MKFNLRRPCSSCPFLRAGPMTLAADRIREIADAIDPPLGQQGKTFACHNTIDYNPDEPDRSGESHCAGALIYARKRDSGNALIQIAERFRLYDPAKLDAEFSDKIWDSAEEWIDNNSWESKR